ASGCLFVFVFFFFFQAEDGIRDRTVTGVQTCALPISWRGTSPGVDPAPGDVTRHAGRRGDEPEIEDVAQLAGRRARADGEIVVVDDLELQHAPAQAARDRDLRVGLACAAQGGHFAFVRLEQDVFRDLHSTAARVAPRRC